MSEIPGFMRHQLDNRHGFFVGELPGVLRLPCDQFESLWNEHPATYREIMMHGKPVKTPRWQQAYGVDYHYSGQNNVALPLLPCLVPLLDFVRQEIDARLNGVLLNWYDAELGHYIGKHRDSRHGMIAGSPIVTVSLGATRTFRIRPWRGSGFTDFRAADGTVFVMLWETNLAYTHEVPHRASDAGRRISVTFRAFQE